MTYPLTPEPENAFATQLLVVPDELLVFPLTELDRTGTSRTGVGPPFSQLL